MPTHGPFTIDTRTTKSLDGTRIAYHVTRPPFEGAPVIALAAGLGASHFAFRPFVRHFEDRYQLLTWDYRGFYGSERPTTEGPEAYSVERHVDDLEAVLRAEKIDRASLLGWSAGAAVALEAVRRAPARVDNLILVSGRTGPPREGLGGAFALARRAWPFAIDVAHAVHPVLTAVTQRLAKTRALPSILKWAGVVGASLDDAELETMVRPLVGLDMDPFLSTLRALAHHDVERALRAVGAGTGTPTLIIAGDRDRWAGPAVAHRVARRIPRAEVLVVRGGTHYAAIEYADLIHLRIEQFYRSCGFGGAANGIG